MKKILIFCAFTLTACSGQNEPQSLPNLIEREKFIPLLVDLQVLESHYHRMFNRPDKYHDALDSASSLVFNKYGVTKKNFEDSFNFYATNVDTIFAIYEAALDSINFRMNQPNF